MTLLLLYNIFLITLFLPYNIFLIVLLLFYSIPLNDFITTLYYTSKSLYYYFIVFTPK